MNKVLSGFTFILLLSVLSCKKENTGTGLGNNTWIVGQYDYSAITVETNGATLVATSGTGASDIRFEFSGSLPGSDGAYQVVSTQPNSGQMRVTATVNPGTNRYTSMGKDTLLSSVTIVDGKMHIKMPRIWARNTINPKDTLQITAYIHQK